MIRKPSKRSKSTRKLPLRAILAFVELSTQVNMLRVCKTWSQRLRLAPWDLTAHAHVVHLVSFQNLQSCALDCRGLAEVSFDALQHGLACYAKSLDSIALSGIAFDLVLRPALAARLVRLDLFQLASERVDLQHCVRMHTLHLFCSKSKPVPVTVSFENCRELRSLDTNLTLGTEHKLARVSRLAVEEISKHALQPLLSDLDFLAVARVTQTFSSDLFRDVDFEVEFDPSEQPSLLVDPFTSQTCAPSAIRELVLNGTSQEHDHTLQSMLYPTTVLSVFHKRFTLTPHLDELERLVLHGVSFEPETLSSVARLSGLVVLVLEHNYSHASEEPEWLDLRGCRAKFLVVTQVWLGYKGERSILQACVNLVEYKFSRAALADCCTHKLVSYLYKF